MNHFHSRDICSNLCTCNLYVSSEPMYGQVHICKHTCDIQINACREGLEVEAYCHGATHPINSHSIQINFCNIYKLVK